MAGDCRIRPARAADCPGLAALEARCFSDPWSAAGFLETLAVPEVVGLVAESKAGDLAGYLVARVAAGEGEILNLAVAAEHRRRGVGAHLLEAGLAAMAARGAGHVFLEVRESNEAAMALYRARGFRPAGRRKAYYRHPVEDAVVLRFPVPPGLHFD